MNPPIYLTDEEIAELGQLWKDYHAQPPSSGWDQWKDSDWMYDYDDEGFSSPKRQRHEWVAILMLNHNVYDCKHCGTHKDKARSDFCDDESIF